MNDSNAKHALEQPDIENPENETENEPLLFFNYHEFLTTNYEVFPSIKHLVNGKAIVVNHFPNNHVPIDSSTYTSTRIIRIPRAFDAVKLSDIIPQFSRHIPGREPASLKGNQDMFRPIGTYDRNVFGETSLTPLIPSFMTEQEYLCIIDQVNKYLYQAFNPYNPWNFMDNLLDLFSANIYNKILGIFISETYSKRKLAQLERYIDKEINEIMFSDRPDLKVISPRRCGYLSVSTSLNLGKLRTYTNNLA